MWLPLPRARPEGLPHDTGSNSTLMSLPFHAEGVMGETQPVQSGAMHISLARGGCNWLGGALYSIPRRACPQGIQ